MKKERTLKKIEIVKVLAKVLNLIRHLNSDYEEATHYKNYGCSVGDWAIEKTYLGQATIESILKITKIDDSIGYYEGIDLLGEKRKWSNAQFSRLPERCIKYLEGEFRW